MCCLYDFVFLLQSSSIDNFRRLAPRGARHLHQLTNPKVLAPVPAFLEEGLQARYS
jgi:hypothetical protein